MAVYINNIIGTGTVRIYGITSLPQIFEGTIENQILPLQFGGEANTFISIDEGTNLPVQFIDSDIIVLNTNTENSLPVSFSG